MIIIEALNIDSSLVPPIVRANATSDKRINSKRGVNHPVADDLLMTDVDSVPDGYREGPVPVQ